jgi:ZIP family zinc transporter
VAEAFLWGLFAASSLIVGGVLAFTAPIGRRTLGLIMAFGAGVLISAVAYDLVLEAADTADGNEVVGAGLAAGALTFFVGDELLARIGARGRKRSDGRQAGGAALGIVLGIVLDGIPESIVIGTGLLAGEGPSAAVITAVFLSNVPESVAASVGLRTAGYRRSRIMALWVLVAVVSATASLLGFALFDGASPGVLAFVLAYAGGAILTMLAETMMPEAYENAGRSVGLLTTLGFALAFAITLMQ